VTSLFKPRAKLAAEILVLQRSVLLSCGRFDTCRRSTLSCWPMARSSGRVCAPGERLGDLARNPLRGRICRHPERYPQSTPVTQHIDPVSGAGAPPPNTIMWSRHSRRIVPVRLALPSVPFPSQARLQFSGRRPSCAASDGVPIVPTYEFCHRDRGAIGLSRMPMG
jgi:hypothetical protein